MSQHEQDLKNIVIVEKPDLLFEDLNGNKIRMISLEDETYLEEKYRSMIQYMRDNHSQDLSEQEKDLMYEDLKRMWNEVSGKDGGKLNSITFYLILHKQECKYLVNLLKNKLEYNVDSVFFAMELENMINGIIENNEFVGDTDAKAFDMTPVDVHYLYQILSQHTVKGLGKNSYYFAEIIKRIALTSKIFNYYKETFTNLSKAIQMWVASLDKGVIINEEDKIYHLIWGDSDKKPSFHVAEKTEDVNTEVVEGEVIDIEK